VKALAWLLEEDNPSARLGALIDLLGRPTDDPEVVAARQAAMTSLPVQRILDAQYPEGFWVHRGAGYSPKYKATVWQIIFLAQLGAQLNEPISRGCRYVLDHSRLPDGRFSAFKSIGGAIACLNGNLLRAMLQLGFDDPRVWESLEALAATVVRDGFRCRFNPSTGSGHRPPGNQGPPHLSDDLPCAWGAIKVLGAFAAVSSETRSPAMKAAIAQGIDFLLSYDLAAGDYPTDGPASTGAPCSNMAAGPSTATGVSRLWHRFGFPLGFTSDVLEALDVLTLLGLSSDPRLSSSIDLVLAKQDAQGRWVLEYTPGNTWASFGTKGQPSKWVTLRALRVLKRVASTDGATDKRMR
jgi:hypothetical protein